jgi:hypothetical protein
VSPPKQCRAVLTHRLTLPDPLSVFCNRSLFSPGEPCH